MNQHGPEVVLIRHGETEWSRSGRHTSRTDLPLTEAGREQAREAGRRIAGQDFALVLASPMARARVTADLAGLGDRAQVRDALREWDYGAYEGVTTKDIRARRRRWYLWRDGCPDGELAEEVGARVDAVVREARDAQGDVAIFGHGHCLRVLAARWLGLAPERGGQLALSTGTLSVLGYEHEAPVIWRWNER